MTQRIQQKPTTLSELRSLAGQKGGLLRSERCETEKDRLVWECDKKHIWEARPLNIRKGKWCPVCARTKRCLDKAG